MNVNLNRNEVIDRLEEAADQVCLFVCLMNFCSCWTLTLVLLDLQHRQFHRKSKHLLPHVARFCLVSTFLEDGARMFYQWSEQRDYMNASWSVGYFIASLFVLFNMVGQLGSSALVLIRKHVKYAVVLLFAIVLLQTIAYSILWDAHFLLRNLSLSGALLLLFAEAANQEGLKRTLLAGVPSLGDEGHATKNIMQFIGRILVSIMFFTVVKFELYFWALLTNIVAGSLMFCVCIGFKSKLSALLLVVWLLALNFYLNAFWTIPSYKPMRDFLKYDFFQTMSVIGGLLMIVSHGPGGLAVDQRMDKKAW